MDVPHWIPSYISEKRFEDDSHWFMQGLEKEHRFWQWTMATAKPSIYTDWGTKWKVTAIEIYFEYDLEHFNRETYNFLVFLGDMGGLYDALLIIGALCVSKVSSIIYTLYAYEHIFIKRDSPADQQQPEPQPDDQDNSLIGIVNTSFALQKTVNLPAENSENGSSTNDNFQLRAHEIADKFKNRVAMNLPTSWIKVICSRKLR